MSQISSADLSSLPRPAELKKLMQALATLEAIIEPDWSLRYYSFNSRWADNEMMGSMRNGSGDDLFVLFNKDGAFIKGFDHEIFYGLKSAPQEVYRDVPECFNGGVTEPAFSPENVTFCYWRKDTDSHWYVARIPIFEDHHDGSAWMLAGLDGDPSSYISFTSEYYEKEIDQICVARVYRHEPMSLDLATSLNVAVDYQALTRELIEIGYPILAQ